MESQVLSMLSSTSASSSSDDDEFWNLLNSNTEILENMNEDSSVSSYIEDTVLNYTDNEFRNHFKVSRIIARQITEKFANSRHFKKRTNSKKNSVSAHAHCLSFLLFVGNKKSYYEISKIFKFSPSTAYKVQTSFLEFLLEISSEFIQMPRTKEERINNSFAFQKIAGLKNVLGCIDVAYIPLRSYSTILPETHINPYGQPAIAMQFICDADSKFSNVFVGATGKNHESVIFEMSHIANEIPQICTREFHILADVTYPLREFILTPFKDSDDMTSQQRIYNERHFQTRIITQHAFNLLKRRFTQLTQLDCFSVMRMAKLVLGCCVLHNLCIDQDDVWIDEEDLNDAEDHLTQYIIIDKEGQAYEEINEGSEQNPIEIALYQSGQTKRDNYIKLF